MKKISIIIPVYNTETYLSRCIKSICSQTYRNLEIICIDDGSTDGSGKIVDEFAREDARIIAVHQNNGGESNARNTGLNVCTGDYIAFVDCDDWIEETMYECLVHTLEKYHVDLVASGWYKDTDQISVEIKNDLPVNKGPFGRSQLLNYLYRRDSYRGFSYMWNKVYKKEILKHSGGSWIYFDESLKLGGDVLYLSQIALNTNTAIYIDEAFYHYLQREDSGCHVTDLNRRMDWLRAYEIVIENFEHEKVEANIMDYVKRFLAYHASNTAELAWLQENPEILFKCQEIMNSYKIEYEKTNQQHPDRILRYEKILNYSFT